ncbi:MAG TPA: hypothetical protein VF399_05090 [bacterium]
MNDFTNLGLPIDQNIMFSDHEGKYKQGIENRKVKLIKKISFIKPFLKSDEKIVMATEGCSPFSVLEQLMTGWYIYTMKRSLLIFTNKRIFHVPIRMNGSYRYSIAQISYADCQKIEMKRGALSLEYRNGKKERFSNVGFRDRKKIEVLMGSSSFTGEPTNTRGRVHLCPRCTNELVAGKYTCPTCHLAFKDKKEAKKISIIYPGGGYFYTNHLFLGISDAITEAIFTLLIIMALVGIFTREEGSIAMLIFFSFFLFIEKMVTVYHSNHFIDEYIPREKTITTAV